MIQANKSEIKNALKVNDSDEVAEVFLYDVIDEYFGVSAEDFAKTLSGLKGKPVNLRVNSPGGDVFDGRAMYAAIKAHGNVTATIDGLAASAASYVALAAKSVEMIDGGFIMIHNAWTLAMGDKNDLMDTAALLDKLDNSIINDYTKKTSLPSDEIADLMNAETWIDANDALEMGFIDSIVDGDESSKSAANNSWDLSAFNNVPKELTEDKTEPESWEVQREMAAKRLRLLNATKH